jgi:pSer/pThr/pTyr-binding forkhead associated (FHA) protein
MPQLIASVEGVEIKHVYLQKDRTTLGRAPDNDIVLDNMVVSGHHCVFELKGLAEVWVEDLRSTNGTYIDGKMVKRQKLRDGDVLAIGNFRVQFKEATEHPSTFGETAAMKLDGPGPVHAAFQVLNGSSSGLEVPVVKAVTTFGKPGTCVVSVSHRREGYFVAHLDGRTAPTLNGERIGADPVLLSNHDVVEIAGTRILFQLED